jgi:CheY-like chemotaxis protein
MNILLAEDDYIQADTLQQELAVHLPSAELTRIRTEHEFMTWLGSARKRIPAVVLIDIMLMWASPDDDVPPPSGWDGHARAGIRCAAALRARPETRDIPIIFYTVLLEDAKPDVERIAHVIHLRKERSVQNLLNAIRSVTGRRRTRTPAESPP